MREVVDATEWCVRAAKLAGITGFSQHQWLVLLTAFPDVSDREVRAAWRVWSENPQDHWGKFAAYLAIAVDIRKERTDEHSRSPLRRHA